MQNRIYSRAVSIAVGLSTVFTSANVLAAPLAIDMTGGQVQITGTDTLSVKGVKVTGISGYTFDVVLKWDGNANVFTPIKADPVTVTTQPVLGKLCTATVEYEFVPGSLFSIALQSNGNGLDLTITGISNSSFFSNDFIYLVQGGVQYDVTTYSSLTDQNTGLLTTTGGWNGYGTILPSIVQKGRITNLQGFNYSAPYTLVYKKVTQSC